MKGVCGAYAMEPRTLTEPRAAGMSPSSAASRDDLPEPTAPTTPTRSPRDADSEIPRRAKPEAPGTPAAAPDSAAAAAAMLPPATPWPTPSSSSRADGGAAVPSGAGHSNVASRRSTPESVSWPVSTVVDSGRERKLAMRPKEREASCRDWSTRGRKTSGERSRLTVAST
eukprot:scaffold10283_cov114-Isochrysis_galbana.AAC.2